MRLLQSGLRTPERGAARLDDKHALYKTHPSLSGRFSPETLQSKFSKPRDVSAIILIFPPFLQPVF